MLDAKSTRSQKPERDLSSSALSVVEGVATLVMLALLGHTLANVVSRTVFNHPLEGTIELAGFWYLPILAYAGFICAQQRGRHIEAPLLFDRLSDTNKRDVQLLGLVLILICTIGFTWFGGKQAIKSVEQQTGSAGLEIPIWPVHVLVPIIFAVLTLQFGAELIRVISGGAARVESNPDEATDQFELKGEGHV